MQQELIEMLEETISYVEVWHKEDQDVLDKAEALVEKAKNNNVPAGPQGEQINKALGKLRAAQWCHPNEVERLIDEAIDALVAATPAPAPAQEVEPIWPLRAKVWKRESTQEWVLDIDGTLGSVNMTCRHTQPLSVAYEDVPGLPALYQAEPQEVGLTDEWAECKRISELPEVDEALRLFAEGETSEDQAVAIVQTIAQALRAKGAS